MTKVISLVEFLENSPLLAKQAVALPVYTHGLYPDKLELECPGCKMSRPFRYLGPSGSGAGMGEPPKVNTGVYRVSLTCAACTQEVYNFWFEVNKEEGWTRKIGQLPPWSIKVDKYLERHLGATIDYYRKALVCLGQGYGLGACTYLRRVLEDTINPLLQLELDVRLTEGATPEEIAELEKAMTTRQFETKTEVAYRLAPASIIVDGTNPMKVIHDRLSAGVHRLTEEQCVEVALTLVGALEFVVTELNRRKESRSAFAKTLRASLKNSPS